MLCCYADYHEDLHRRPPCDEAWHERTFGLVRSDGSLKPHAEVLRRFAATRPTVQPASRRVVLDWAQGEYYRDPLGRARAAFQAFLDERPAPV